jgi:hypothetical protein
MTLKSVKIALTILTCTSLSLPPTVAEAGMRTGTWRNGMVAGPYGVSWYGPHGYYPPPQPHYGGYYGAAYGAPYGYGGYTPGYYGYYPGYYYRERRSNSGAALAAGLIGGIALGAILANSTARVAPRCYVVPRRVAGASADTYIGRVRTCH